MPFVQAFCPKCHKELSVPDDLDSIICNYCGEHFKLRIINKDDLSKTDYQSEIDMAYELINNEQIITARPDDEVFTRSTYIQSFDEYCEIIDPALEHLFTAADILDNAVKTEEIVKQYGEHIVGLVCEKMNESKSIDAFTLYTRHMISFVIPSITIHEITYSTMLASYIVDCWNEKYPKNQIKITTFDEIDSGFSRSIKWCYITTAVCQSLNKPDDCPELTSFRKFRDNWLIKQDFGMSAIYDYYNTAPNIVAAINSSNNSSDEYKRIWCDYLDPCYNMINTAQNTECYFKYKDMVSSLKNKWL